MKYARLLNDTVVEIIAVPAGFNLQDCYHPDIVKDILLVDGEVGLNWVRQEDGTFVDPVAPVIETPTPVVDATEIVS